MESCRPLAQPCPITSGLPRVRLWRRRPQAASQREPRFLGSEEPPRRLGWLGWRPGERARAERRHLTRVLAAGPRLAWTGALPEGRGRTASAPRALGPAGE